MKSLVAFAVASHVALSVEGMRSRRSTANSTGSDWKAVLVPGKIDIKRPAFLMLDKGDIVISQFGRAKPTDKGGFINLPAASQISKVPIDFFAEQMKGRSLSGTIGDEAFWVTAKEMLWPNKLARVPEEYGDYIVVPDGFLPPGKSNGNMYLADASGSLHRISPEEKGAFYHEVEWHDFNGDGLKDMLTARVVKSGFFVPKFTGNLMWYENPGVDKITGLWKQHIITTGPDVIFRQKPYGDGFAVYTTEFFGKVPRLSVQFINKQGVKTGARIIDDNMGKPFGIEINDINGDGIDDLLVTNHQNNEEDEIKAAIYAYEIPEDLATGDFKRHTLAYDLSQIKEQTPGVGSPGFAMGFHPKKDMTGAKHIVCAGDGSFDVWYLRPTGKPWDWEASVIDIGGTTGEMLLHDFDGDGVQDVLVPDNDLFKLHMITFEQ